MTKISWSDITWNPLIGCTRCSPGCDSCYAITTVSRGMHETHKGLTERNEELGRMDWTGEVRFLPGRLETPFTWPGRKRVFVNSLSDLYEPSVPTDVIAQIFAVMALTPQHSYQVLTKRHVRMRDLSRSFDFRCQVGFYIGAWATNMGLDPADPAFHRWPLPNLWSGVSVENQRYANMRIPALLDADAAVRWISAEPLLGPVSIGRWIICVPHGRVHCDECTRIDWVVVGGESGGRARPMHPEWARDLRDQCGIGGVPFHFKQWGAWSPRRTPNASLVTLDGEVTTTNDYSPFMPPPDVEPMLKVGAKRAGRELDGRIWDEYPSIVEEGSRA